MDQAKTRRVSYERLFEMMMNKDWAFAHTEPANHFCGSRIEACNRLFTKNVGKVCNLMILYDKFKRDQLEEGNN